jgi:hypothetical protein
MLSVEVGLELARQQSRGEVLAAISRAAVGRVAGTDWASITELHSGRFTTVAASDEAARAVDGIQYELDTGPCLEAIRGGATVRTGDLVADGRWPAFAARAAGQHGVASMLSLHLHAEDGDRAVGLNLYSTSPHAFAGDAEIASTLLAVHASLAILAASAREEADNLRRALVNSRVISTAIGVLMSARKLTSAQAFDLLRIASQHSNRKLAEIAAEVAETGTLDHPNGTDRRRRS